MSAHSITSRGLTGRKIPQGTLTPIGALLFSASEPGAWYDPSDLSTLFQDAAGATPVTAVEQPVGRMLDKSGRGNHATQATTTKRPVLSRWVNFLKQTENFASADWVKVGCSFSGTKLTEDTSAASAHALQQTSTYFPANSTISFKAVVSAAGRNWCLLWDTTNNRRAWFSLATGQTGDGMNIISSRITQVAPGVYECEMVFTNPTASVNMRCAAANTSGNAFYTGDGVSGINIFKTSLTLATDAHLPYQWVNTATDYDADPSKFPAYLRFDGVDDALQTGNIDFTSTDKMTVWAGVTKLSDALAGVLVELSATANTNNGAFKVLAPDPPGANIAASSRGTATNAANQRAEISAAAPGSFVIASASDIAGDRVSLRVNSVSAPQAVGDQGDGNYGNYPLYIGARAGTSLYFNGRLYSLIVRGAQTPLSQIEATELYIKQKMRMP